MSGHHVILYTLSTVSSISLKFFLKVQKRSGKKIYSLQNTVRCQKNLSQTF